MESSSSTPTLPTTTTGPSSSSPPLWDAAVIFPHPEFCSPFGEVVVHPPRRHPPHNGVPPPSSYYLPRRPPLPASPNYQYMPSSSPSSPYGLNPYLAAPESSRDRSSALPTSPDGPSPSEGPAAEPAWWAPRVATAATLAGLTGVLVGLTAAATWRWLQGYDWAWCPPLPQEDQHVIAPEFKEMSLQEDPDRLTEEEEEVENNKDDPTWDYHPPPEGLLEPAQTDETNPSAAALLHRVEAQLQRQENLLQRLVHQRDEKYTSQSMKHLRQQKEEEEGTTPPAGQEMSPTSSDRWTQLRSILQELQSTLPRAQENGEVMVIPSLESIHTQLERAIQNLDDDGGPDVPELNSERPGEDPGTPRHGTMARTVPLEFRDMKNPSPPENNYNHDADLEALASSTSAMLVEAVGQLAQENDPVELRVGAQLLFLYVVNLSSHPHIPRYRKIYTANDSFQKVERLTGGRKLLQAVGYVDQGKYLEWLPTSDRPGPDPEELQELYLSRLQQAAAALSILKSPQPQHQQAGPDLASWAMAAAAATAYPGSSPADEPGPPPPTPVATPRLPAGTALVEAREDDPELLLLKTPDGGGHEIISPPPTKKSHLHMADFPPVHPLATPSPHHHHHVWTEGSSPDSSTPQSPDDIDQGDAEDTNVMWK